jgi:hypothetical protein
MGTEMKMKPTQIVLLAGCTAALGACHLKELDEQPPGAIDASTPVESDAGPRADAPIEEPADAAIDAPPDDPEIPPGSPLGSCNPVTWTASASSSEVSNPPGHGIDGLLPSRWSSGAGQTFGMYYQVDFGAFVMVDGIDIEPMFGMDGMGDYPRGLDVRVSYDGVDFSRKLASATFNTDPGEHVVVDFAPHAARYLRLELTQGIGNWFTIHELHIGCSVPEGGPADAGVDGGAGAGDGVVDPNRAGWTVTANFTSAADPLANAIDGNPQTRWASGKSPQYGDELFRLDLGVAATVHKVVLDASASPTDYPSAWRLDVSTDDLTYETVAAGLGAAVTTMVFPPREARYLRVKQIGSGYAHWWGIHEISVVQPQ